MEGRPFEGSARVADLYQQFLHRANELLQVCPPEDFDACTAWLGSDSVLLAIAQELAEEATRDPSEH